MNDDLKIDADLIGYIEGGLGYQKVYSFEIDDYGMPYPVDIYVIIKEIYGRRNEIVSISEDKPRMKAVINKVSTKITIPRTPVIQIKAQYVLYTPSV